MKVVIQLDVPEWQIGQDVSVYFPDTMLKHGKCELLNEQQPKTGHWLKKMSNYPSAIAMGGSRTSACDLCGGWGRKTFKYCPHCGAKMEEPTRT